MAEVALRPVDDSDLDALFEQRRDPESVRMAAFTAEDPDNRAAFDVHMANVRTSPEGTMRAITADGRLVGSIASFVIEGDTEVTYWIDRSFWRQGIAGRALALFLESVPIRPLFARVASDNVGSLKVLRKAAFAITGTETSFANGRNAEIEETILRLDEPAKTRPSMDANGMKRYVDETFDGVNAFENSGDTFCIYDPDRDLPAERQLPFATIVTGDRYDTVSDLNRPDTYRLNIGLTKATYSSMFGAAPARRDEHGVLDTGFDYTATDTIMPHPIYASQYWVCVLNPGEATLDTVWSLLDEAHRFAVRKHANHQTRRTTS